MKMNILTKHFAASAFVAVFCVASSATAGIITQWTMEAPNTPADTTAATGPSVAAATGTGTLQGVHASATTAWSTPSGNGSAESYSSNTWAVGDYIQFSTATTGSSSIGVIVDHTSSNTGPKDFRLDYSINGGAFVNSGLTYAVQPNAAPNPTWNSTTFSSLYRTFFDLSSISGLNNAASVAFRLINTTTNAAAAAGGTVAAGGTSRVDNLTVLDNVPEPTGIVLAMICAACLGLARRVKR